MGIDWTQKDVMDEETEEQVLVEEESTEYRTGQDPEDKDFTEEDYRELVDAIEEIKSSNPYSGLVEEVPSNQDFSCWATNFLDGIESTGTSRRRLGKLFGFGSQNKSGELWKFEKYVEAVIDETEDLDMEGYEEFEEILRSFLQTDTSRKLSLSEPRPGLFEFEVIAQEALDSGEELEVLGEDYLHLSLDKDSNFIDSYQDTELERNDTLQLYHRAHIGRIINEETLDIYVNEDIARNYIE